MREYLRPGGGSGSSSGCEAPAISGCAASLCAAAGSSDTAARPSNAARQAALQACRERALPGDAGADVSPAAAGDSAPACDAAATPAAVEGSAAAGAAAATSLAVKGRDGVPPAAGDAAAGRRGTAAAGAVDCSVNMRQPGAAADRKVTNPGGGGHGGGGGETAFSVVKLGVSGLTLLQAPGASRLSVESALHQLRPSPLTCVTPCLARRSSQCYSILRLVCQRACRLPAGLLPGEATAAVAALLSDITAGRRPPLE